MTTRHYLAAALFFQGKYDQAETEYRAVLQLREKILGPEHPDTLKTRNNLALALDYQAKYADAEPEYRELLRLKEKVLGPEDPSTLITRSGLADTLDSEGKYVEAETEYRTVVRLKGKVEGPGKSGHVREPQRPGERAFASRQICGRRNGVSIGVGVRRKSARFRAS